MLFGGEYWISSNHRFGLRRMFLADPEFRNNVKASAATGHVLSRELEWQGSDTYEVPELRCPRCGSLPPQL